MGNARLDEFKLTNTIRLRGIVTEDFVNYKLPSMFLITCSCDWKCCREQSVDSSICQNESLCQQPIKTYKLDDVYKSYISNDISQSIVFGGLEPFQQFDEMLSLIKYFRDNNCNDDIVIYTGFYEQEINAQLEILRRYKNIVVKFGRFILNQPHHIDTVLKVELASPNQYAERIS